MATSTHIICIIEDEPGILNLYQEAFRHFPDVALEAVSVGTEAIPMLLDRQYAAIIIDLKLPGINGVQLVSHTKEKVNHKTPIFVISGYFTEEVLALAQHFGVVETITKPFDPDIVAGKIYARILEVEKPIRHDVKITRAFLDVTGELFSYYFGAAPIIDKQEINPTRAIQSTIISGIISIAGNGFIGTMSLSVEGSFIKILAESVFPKFEFGISKGLAADILGVLCFQIMEKVKNKIFNEETVMISPPSVIIGKEHSIFHKIECPLFRFPMTIREMHCVLEFYFDFAKS